MNRWGLLAALIVCVLAAVTLRSSVFASTVCWSERAPVEPVEIFEGVVYGCERLDESAEGSGHIHWVRVDLTAPGLELYVTPLDPEAKAAGWQYRLRRVAKLVKEEHLAVAVNASMFTPNASWRPGMSGDFARGVETVVADHEVSHFWEHTYLLWFDDGLVPHLSGLKPPSPTALTRARWGVGGQGIGLWKGEVRRIDASPPDARTAIAVDGSRKILFLAVASNITPQLLLRKLSEQGARDGMLLDGGTSSSMAIGAGAKGIRPGAVFGGLRPVATQFGIRAKPLGEAAAAPSQ